MSLLVTVLLAAAAQDGGDEFFETKIRPVLVEQCQKCHGEKKAKGGLRLDSRSGWEKGGDNGPAILRKKASASLLIKMIRRGEDSPPQMPPEHPLAASVVDDFVRWVDLGAPDPRTGTVAVAKQIDWKAAGEFWAFRPPAASRSRPIDAYLEEKLAAQKLKPAAAADRWTLLRRVTFDLTGLPPTEAEMKAFLEDSSPGAFEKVVDRLLASPAYGEHQARLWLDVARYAEDQAHVTEGKLGFAWRYRDWVIEAFNKDLPYDRFVKLQIAADLMDDATDPADRRALGFIGLGNIYARPNDLARAKAEQWDDRVDTLSRAFLGLTVSCARCHDHKFDPIPTLDYYSLTGVIADTKDSVVWIAPKDEVAAYEAAAAASAEVAGKASAFLQAETDRRALEKIDTLVEAALEVWADPAKNKGLAEFLKKEKTPKTREGAEKLQKYVRENALQPIKKRNLDQFKGLFGEKGAYPLPEKIVVDAASPEWRKEYEPLQAAAKEIAAKVPPEPAKAHGVADIEKCTDLKVYVRGNPYKTGENAPRRFLRILAGAEAPLFKRGSGRLELAEAIADARNPLTARVMVNRIWQQHFGRGLVATPSNFGALGMRPTHPELLDALADRFIREKWSVKRLHQELLLTAAYQRSSAITAANQVVDPENQWLWRWSRRRLSIEELRDASLAASGTLDRTLYGASGDVDEPAYARRTIYGRVSRMELSKLLRLFDFPDPNLSSERRIDTTLPQQSLFLLNSPFVIARARALAALETADPAGGIYKRLFGREPSREERELAAAYLSAADAEPAKLTRAERYAQALLAGNAFLFVD
jgi:cytochrome c553